MRKLSLLLIKFHRSEAPCHFPVAVQHEYLIALQFSDPIRPSHQRRQRDRVPGFNFSLNINFQLSNLDMIAELS